MASHMSAVEWCLKSEQSIELPVQESASAQQLSGFKAKFGSGDKPLQIIHLTAHWHALPECSLLKWKEPCNRATVLEDRHVHVLANGGHCLREFSAKKRA